MKDTGLMRKFQPRDKKLVNQLFLFTTATYYPSQDETTIGVVRQKCVQSWENGKLTNIKDAFLMLKSESELNNNPHERGMDAN